MDRVQKTKQATERTQDTQAEPVPGVETNKAHEYTDEVLADIDETLAETLKVSGETAEQFVDRFRQRGGE